jgi:flagellar biosynthetic protein FliQ
VSAAFAVDLIRRAVVLTLMVSAPLLVTAVLVGLIVTLLQAVTQLQEQTLTLSRLFVIDSHMDPCGRGKRSTVS